MSLLWAFNYADELFCRCFLRLIELHDFCLSRGRHIAYFIISCFRLTLMARQAFHADGTPPARNYHAGMVSGLPLSIASQYRFLAAVSDGGHRDFHT